MWVDCASDVVVDYEFLVACGAYGCCHVEECFASVEVVSVEALEGCPVGVGFDRM